MKKYFKSIIHNLPYIRRLRKNLFSLSDNLYDSKMKGHKILLELAKYKIQLNVLNEVEDYELLIFLELKFGGYITNVTPTIKDKEFLKKSPSLHTGGDRFNPFYHDYSGMYSKYLHNLRNNKIKLLEVGILKGTGLAVWSKYFNDVDIYGFDWDLGIINANLDNLISLGAFQKNKPKLFQYNQLINNQQWLEDNFSDIKFNVIIDDALHTDKAIINTFSEIQPYLSDDFVYFIEDNTSAFKKLEKKYPEYHFDNEGELTVVTKK